jgi:phospholipase/carboxylesterase
MSDTIQLDLPLNNLIRKSEKTTGPGPTIFFLHGFGSNMQDLFGLTQFFGREWNCISLQASIPVDYGGWAWAELDHKNIKELPRPQQMRDHHDRVIESIEKSVELLDLDPMMIDLLGFSQGATLSMYCGLIDPSKFRSIVALCGFLPVEKIRPEIDLDVDKDVDIFMGNGLSDMIVPISFARDSRDGLISLGVSPTYKEYDSEHTIPNDCLSDVIKWLNKKNVQ